MSDTFPYGNDLSNPGSWAGLANTKSKTWLMGYDTGWSLLIGAHTCLFFGCESLVAFSATLYGAGGSASYGASKIAKRVERSSKSSRFPNTGELSDDFERMEDLKDAKDVTEWAKSNSTPSSATDIYKKLHSQTNSMEALVPFCYHDLEWTWGAMSGVAVDAVIGGATYYLVDASDLFTEANVFNVTTGETLLSAGIGTLWGVWRVGKFYSLWNELAYSEKEEYPFGSYNVHPFFRNWKSPRFAEAQLREISKQRAEIINRITKDMMENPSKYGFGDELQALNKVVEMNEKYQNSGGNPAQNPYLPWVPFEKQHIFYGGQ